MKSSEALNLYHVQITYEQKDGTEFWTDHAYFEGDPLVVEEKPIRICVYDPEKEVFYTWKDFTKDEDDDIDVWEFD